MGWKARRIAAVFVKATAQGPLMILSLRSILLTAAVVIFVLDALKVWRLGLNPLPLGLALAFGSCLI
jgi:hypothetical protein